ncbi:MAG: SGNH/GDSL hydrolase family protein [Chloroflexi bacterium]|uniref:SGNH/GDSL hydrolase family protein n=1 Tax=Candidatus Chlorohelix allophototropha TaxID=3003348 RepID=A0A8T7M902_9CHLR|nr:SGNH/GDSL hydrolase family protein [Chloroflexota bacterium]WJW68453.1 SGNH/GDSL hydrolase family protein [Chloroflexota bacterium L227-S17]
MKKLSAHSIIVTLIALALLIVTLALFFTLKNFVDEVQSNTEFVQPVATIPAPTPTLSPTPRVTIGHNDSAAPIGIGDLYLALGDSVGYGLGAPTPYDMGFAGLFYNNYLKRVRPAMTPYKNLAIPGESSSSFFEAKPGNKSQLQLALDEIDKAKIAGKTVSPITLTLGGNDMLDNRNKSEQLRNSALQQFETNFSRALDELKAHTGNRSDIIVTTYYNPYIYQTGGGSEDEQNNWVKRFDESIKRIALDKGVRVADFFAPFFQHEGDYTWIKFGDVHPNASGYNVLARALWQASGYDREGSSLSLSYQGIPDNRKLQSGERITFKLVAADNIVSSKQAETPGAGSIAGVFYTMDGLNQTPLAAVPALYLAKKAEAEFTCIVDTTGLVAGKHILNFVAQDMAGNTSKLEIDFEVSG